MTEEPKPDPSIEEFIRSSEIKRAFPGIGEQYKENAQQLDGGNFGMFGSMEEMLKELRRRAAESGQGIE